jgi:hypothetical protein
MTVDLILAKGSEVVKSQEVKPWVMAQSAYRCEIQNKVLRRQDPWITIDLRMENRQ